MGVIRYCPEHGPDHGTVHGERPVFIHSVPVNDRDLLPAHFYMVVMRNVIADVPSDGIIPVNGPSGTVSRAGKSGST